LLLHSLRCTAAIAAYGLRQWPEQSNNHQAISRSKIPLWSMS
jgi:hypothetical protein